VKQKTRPVKSSRFSCGDLPAAVTAANIVRHADHDLKRHQILGEAPWL
jgi:hypothetical protein